MGSGHKYTTHLSSSAIYKHNNLIYIMETHYKFINVLVRVIKICFNSINNIKCIESAFFEVHCENVYAVQHILIKICFFRETNSQEGII